MNLNIGIDIGAANVRMVVKGRGIALDQPSCCAMKNGTVISLGDEAYALWGREYASVEVAFPITAGVIASEEALEAWLKYMISQAASMGLARISRVLIAKPKMMSLAQTQRYAAAAMRAGATFCALMSSDLLSALGEGIDIQKPRGSFVMNIGASQMTATAFVRSTAVSSGYINYGMDSANDVIARMIRDKYALKIGPATAESVKISLAGTSPKGGVVESCSGFDLSKGFPGAANIACDDVRSCLEPFNEKIRQLAMAVLGDCEARVLADISDDGAYISGGGARLYGLAESLQAAAQVKFVVGETPELAVANGLIKVLEDPDIFETFMEAQQSLFDKRTPGR